MVSKEARIIAVQLVKAHSFVRISVIEPVECILAHAQYVDKAHYV